ncbi:uncharacterized protein LOC106664383 [Cimex lectularius]|uniref:phospholipase A2 n=1 Tax=Cimex lectularius TaxID=79782 RepID=A0A8I6RLE4_CIMLE|nr:uncharacterized protein LOC106664383 [Cimex lectularius]
MRIRVSAVVFANFVLVLAAPGAAFIQPPGRPDEPSYLSGPGVVGKQTPVPHYDRMKLREVAEGSKILLGVFIDEDLVDCELRRNSREASNLRLEVQAARDDNATYLDLNHLNRGPELSWLNFSAFARDCRKKQKAQTKTNSRRRRSLLSNKPRRHSRSKVLYRTRHDDIAMNRYHIKQNLITPGTKWCGPNNQAKKYTDLGGFWKADKCCRKHDTCDQSIGPFSVKYSLPNGGPFTMSHCSCDKRFRRCLKMADTGAATFVGKVFFFIQKQCFVTRTEKVCNKRNWRGKCQSSSYDIVAHVRDNFVF